MECHPVDDHSFSLFAQLPLELRLRIWQHTLPDSRTVALRCHAGTPYNHVRSTQNSVGWFSKEPIPVALFVCQESRQEAKLVYKLAFSSSDDEPRVWFGFETDNLMFEREHDYALSMFVGGLFYDIAHGEENNIKGMVLEVSENLFDMKTFCWESIKEFKNLERLELRFQEEECDTIVDAHGNIVRLGSREVVMRHVNPYKDVLAEI